MKTLAGLLRGRAHTIGDHIALRCRDGEAWRERDWAAYWDGAQRAAAGLWARGVRPGAHLLMLVTDVESAILTLFGAWSIGAVPIQVGLPFRLHDLAGFLQQLRETARSLDAGALVLSAALAPYAPAAAGLPVFVAEELLASEPLAGLPDPDDFAGHTALIQLTSGSTGRPRGVVLAGLLALGALLPSCNREVSAAKKAPGGPVEVGVMTVTASPVTLTTELPGRTSAVRVAEVRARVNGIVQKRLFTEGSDVKEGQPLFEIDPAPYRAALSGAKAALVRAEANRKVARQQAERLEALVASNTASREELERVTATAATAEADVAAARATLTQARLNLEYTRVTAPIAGRIGRSAVTEGAYVQQATATLMGTIQQLDPVYVDLTQSTAEVLRLRRAMEAAVLQAPGAETKVTLILEDGRAYTEPGTLQFSDVTVDTGVPVEDASQFIDGLKYPVGPTSTSIAVAVSHAINASTTAELVRRGVEPMIMVNTNSNRTAEAHKQNDKNYEELWRRLRNRDFSAPVA